MSKQEPENPYRSLKLRAELVKEVEKILEQDNLKKQYKNETEFITEAVRLRLQQLQFGAALDALPEAEAETSEQAETEPLKQE